MKLTKAEERLMCHLWLLKKAFMKDLLNAYSTPKPASTTIATLLKRMIAKDFVVYTEFGNSREYYPKVKKAIYFSNTLNEFITNFFNNSAFQFAEFFTAESNLLSKKELKEIKKLIDIQLQKKKK